MKLDDKAYEKMFKVAEEALKNAYPSQRTGFAVAVLTKKGNIYAGVSYCSDTYTLTMHAEATALAHAAIHGEIEIAAITGPNCHICKQLIYESSLRSGIDTLTVMKEKDGFSAVPISEMMPYPWPIKPFDI